MSALVVDSLMSKKIKEITIDDVKSISKENNEPDWFLNQRIQAFKHFERLPLETNVLYKKYIDSDLINLEDQVFDIPASNYSLDDLRPENGRPYLITIDGKLAEVNLPDSWAEKGVLVQTVREFFEAKSDFLEKYLTANLAHYTEEKIANLVISLAPETLVIYIPSNAHLEEPLLRIDVETTQASSAISRLVMILDDNAEFTFISELHSIPFEFEENTEEYSSKLNAELLEVHTGAGSRLKVGVINVSSRKTATLKQLVVDAGRDSSIEWLNTYLGGSITFGKSTFRLAGNGSHVTTYECIFADKEQNIILATESLHQAPNTIGHIYNRAVVTDHSTASSIGLATVKNEAPNADSNVVESALLVGDNASSNSFPFLAIDTSEVKAGHAASVSKLDEDLVFYVMSRGLPRDSTEQLLIRGYLDPVIQMHPTEIIRTLAHELVLAKWDGVLGKPLLPRIHSLKTTEAL